MNDPFPAQRVRWYLGSATPAQRRMFALANAERTYVLAEELVGALRRSDDRALTTTLDQLWLAATDVDATRLSGVDEALMVQRLVDDDDPVYSTYNSAVNDALTAAIYAAQAFNSSDAEPELCAAEVFYNLVDFAIHRERSTYVTDLLQHPAIQFAVRLIVSDCAEIAVITTDATARAYRDVVRAQTQELVALC